MSFAEIYGWAIELVDGGQQAPLKDFGTYQPSYLDRPLHGRRALVDGWSFATSVLTAEEAETLECIAAGEGHHFALDGDLWGDDGEHPEAGATYTHSLVDGPLLGFSFLADATWDLELPDRWTFGVWRRATDGTGSWGLYFVRHDGAKWLDGARNDGLSTTWATVADGGINIDGGARYAGLVVIPCHVDDTAIEAWSAWAAAGGAFAFPLLVVEGDALETRGETLCCPALGDATYLQHGGAGGWVNNARRVAFTLEVHEPRELVHPPRPDHGYQLLTTEITGGTTLLDRYGDQDGTITGTTTGQAGPYGHEADGAFEWDGVSAEHIALPAELVQNLVGARAVSLLAWVKRTDSGGPHTIIDLEESAGVAKFRVQFSADVLRVRAGAELLQLDHGDNEDLTEFHSVLAIVDRAAGELVVGLDGEITGRAAATFANPVFDGLAGTSRIGRLGDDSELFEGLISRVYLYKRRLTASDFARFHRLGRRGIFA